MLKFLRKHRAETCVVIIDDVSRLARGLEAHLQLRTAINAAGGKLESPSIEFGEDSDSQLVENMLASVSQHQRQKNAEQTRNRMRARAMNGYWVFQPPAGYRFERVSGHGRMLVRVEPLASVLTEAMEGYALGRFDTQVEVKRFLEASTTELPRNRSGEIRNQRVTDLLTQVLYAGYIDLPDWGIRLVQGKHEPLISYETFKTIQSRLGGTAKAPARKNLRADFPLRGFVTCGDCGKPMTACWSKGRTATYPYYLCPTRGCESYGKSVRKEKMEAEFEELLLDLRPSEKLYDLAGDTFRDLWDERLATSRTLQTSIEGELRGLENQIEQLLDRVVAVDSPALINTYEKRIRTLEERKVLMHEKVRNCGRPLKSFDETFRTAFRFFRNPHKLWASDQLVHRRTLLKLVFADPLPYVRNEGFRTAAYTPPFSVLQALKGGENGMARPGRLELPTS